MSWSFDFEVRRLTHVQIQYNPELDRDVYRHIQWPIRHRMELCKGQARSSGRIRNQAVCINFTVCVYLIFSPGTRMRSCRTRSASATIKTSYALRDRTCDNSDVLQIVALQDNVIMLDKKTLKKPTRTSLAAPRRSSGRGSGIVKAAY